MRFADEEAFTAKLARRIGASRNVRVGIGDDAAIVRLASAGHAFTTDTLVDRIDFLAGELPYWIGRRAAAANLSDLAAMGATPVGGLLTLGLPRDKGLSYGWEIAEGVVSKLEESGAALWGGDLTRSREVFVTVCLVGRVARPVTRAGARPGDLLFVTGSPGQARRGLRRRRRRRTARLTAAERGFLDPAPRIRFASALARRRLATAMIDVSDGIGRDAARLAKASRVRVVLDGIGPGALRESGDDLELLFTAAPSRVPDLLRLAGTTDTPITRIGLVSAGAGVSARTGGRSIPVAGWGYDHFRR